MLREIDGFIIEQFDKLIKFMQDWLCISQNRIERSLLVLFCLICGVDIYLVSAFHGNMILEVMSDLFVFLGMLSEYKQNKTQRTLRKVSGYLFRIVLVFLCIFGLALNSALILSKPTNFNPYLHIFISVEFLWMVVPSVMSYITVLDVDGEKGRAAKLSWEKMKELFGTEWVPQPSTTRV